MKIRSIVTLVIASILALDAFAQRVDLGLDGFRKRIQTEQQIVAPYLVLITTSQPFEGGAVRCVDFQRALLRFGGIGFVPSRLQNGQVNRGRGEITLLPYSGRGCTGSLFAKVRATPAFDDTTPRDVEFPITFTGTIPPAAQSGLFSIDMVATGLQPFQFCFRGPFLEISPTAPDLDPEVTIHVGDLAVLNVGTSGASFSLTAQGQPMERGDILPRTRFLLMYVDVKNVGSAEANLWTVTLRPPLDQKGVSLFRFSSLPSNCRDFDGSGVHNATSPLGPNEGRRLCAALVPNREATAVFVSAETFVAHDANPANNTSSSDFFAVEVQRAADPRAAAAVNGTKGRK